MKNDVISEDFMSYLASLRHTRLALGADLRERDALDDVGPTSALGNAGCACRGGGSTDKTQEEALKRIERRGELEVSIREHTRELQEFWTWISQHLSEDAACAVWLRHVHGLSFPKIGEAMEMRPWHVRPMCHEAEAVLLTIWRNPARRPRDA